MSLSYFIPDSSLKSGYYNLFTKFGRLGGHYAISEIPFKNPLILMTPGSVFKIEEKKPYYGVTVKGIHKKEEIRHQTYFFPYFLTLAEENNVF
jgi:CRISPR/Cas system CSM-associated protein Csm4 (group 5 of RAMP superfamily)